MIRVHRIRLTASAVTLAAALAVGCGRSSTDTSSTTGHTPLDPVITTMDDDRIVAAVRSDYFASDQVKAENIDVSSDHGTVTLKGQVASDDARKRAVSIARNVKGVTGVNDRLQVESSSTTAHNGAAAHAGRSTASNGSTDTTAAMVTTKILAQYYVHPQLKPWNIDVSTSQDGVVTLEGTIDNDKDRTEAVRIAKATDGVTDVRDRLRAKDVAATSGTTTGGKDASVSDELSNAWITTKIQSRFFLDPDIKGRDINVDTNNGVVVLRGTVGSYSARRQAVSVARNTDGVHEVRDELRVDATGGRGEAAGSRARHAVPDDQITTKIRSKFFAETDLRASGIDVSSRRGVVTLSGTVDSKDAKDTAVRLAHDTDGVRNVQDRLKVQPAKDTQ